MTRPAANTSPRCRCGAAGTRGGRTCLCVPGIGGGGFRQRHDDRSRRRNAARRSVRRRPQDDHPRRRGAVPVRRKRADDPGGTADAVDTGWPSRAANSSGPSPTSRRPSTRWPVTITNGLVTDTPTLDWPVDGPGNHRRDGPHPRTLSGLTANAQPDATAAPATFTGQPSFVSQVFSAVFRVVGAVGDVLGCGSHDPANSAATE